MIQKPVIVRREVEVANAQGLHFRPASEFVRLAQKYQSEISIHHNGGVFNGKSVLEIATLAADFGARIEIIGRGSDAEEAVRALAELVASPCDETDQASGPQSKESSA